MNADPSGRPDPRETREVKLLADIPRLATEVISLSENLEPPFAEESVYTFNASGRILRLPEHLQNFVTLSEDSPKVVGVEVRFSVAKALDFTEMMVAFELSNGQIVRATRAGGSSINQEFSVSLKQDGHDYTEAMDMSYKPFTSAEIARLLTGLIFDRTDRASFPDGHLNRLDIQDYGTSALLRTSLENKCDDFRMRKAVQYDDPQGHRLVVTEAYNSAQDERFVQINATTITVDDADGLLVAIEKTETMDFGGDPTILFQIQRQTITRNLSADSDELPRPKISTDTATTDDFARINRYLYRFKTELLKHQPETVGYDDIAENED